MASRSDQLHSHQFALQRVVGALAMRDPDSATSPGRRIGGALFASVMVAVLAVAAVGVYGLLRPGTGDAWREGRATIIEKETGARYVYVDGVLYPVLNYTSAILLLGTTETVQVARSALVGVPRGTPVGIPGVPDPLPGPDQLVTDPWTLCSRPASSDSGPESVLRIGWVPEAAPLGDAGILAVDSTGEFHLVWNNRRFALVDPELVLAAFTWVESSAVEMSTAVLNTIPAGPALGPVSTPRSARASALPGLRVGEVFVVTNPDGRRLYGVALEDGVSTVTAVQAALLVADNANGGDPAREISPADYAAAPKLPDLVPTGDDAPPAHTPTQVSPGQRGAVCATFTPGTALPTVTIVDALPPVTGETAVPPDPEAVGLLADHVAVPPGRGVLVESLASPTAPSGSLAVVSDLGQRFAVPSADLLGVLGYGSVQPQRLPASLVALVPAGPALDPAAAGLPANRG
ncbi:MAG: type VII secretion protein EccB [Micromonosporaceae bacterium]|nr:type VII secretion protein EccB [Micromonosporaceae bacterium]